MPTSPITHETSLKNRPVLRGVLLGVWGVVIIYTVVVLGAVLSPQFSSLKNSNFAQMILGIPTLLQLSIDYGVDLLLIFGFSVIGGMLIVRRSDDLSLIHI